MLDIAASIARHTNAASARESQQVVEGLAVMWAGLIDSVIDATVTVEGLVQALADLAPDVRGDTPSERS